MPRLTNDRPYVAWWRWLLCWLLLHRLCEWRITNETWTFVNQIKSFIMTKYTAMHGVEWSLECRWRGNVARHSGRFCKVAKRLRINSIWWSCWWLKTHGWRQYFVFSSRTRWTGGWGRMCPANVMNTSGGKRLVTLIKVTGGGGVGRAEAGDKTTPRHAACGRTGVVELRGASPGRQSWFH